MRAAIFYEAHAPLQIEDVPIPALSAGEVLVKVAACGLCHTDLHYTDHGVPTVKHPPLILGHEATGIVALDRAWCNQHKGRRPRAAARDSYLWTMRGLSRWAREYLPAHAHVRQ